MFKGTVPAAADQEEMAGVRYAVAFREQPLAEDRESWHAGTLGAVPHAIDRCRSERYFREQSNQAPGCDVVACHDLRAGAAPCPSIAAAGPSEVVDPQPARRNDVRYARFLQPRVPSGETACPSIDKSWTRVGS